jgi:hypothetical protein
MRLVYNETGEEVKIGDKVELNGVDYKVTFIIYPWNLCSNGRVEVKSDIGQFSRYFPSVIGAYWIEKENQHA